MEINNENTKDANLTIMVENQFMDPDISIDSDDENCEEDDPDLLKELMEITYGKPIEKAVISENTIQNKEYVNVTTNKRNELELEDNIIAKDLSDGNLETKETIKKTIMDILNNRLLEYKKAALKAKREDNKELALRLLKVMKQLDGITNMTLTGVNVDISDIPPPPDQSKVSIY